MLGFPSLQLLQIRRDCRNESVFLEAEHSPLVALQQCTIALLQTNRDGVMNMRRVLTLMDEHPPS
jgi:hypothetical protein